jgi:hypothetical protein
MADDYSGQQPFATPDEFPEERKAAATLPGGLKAICIIAIVLGSFGVLATIASSIGLVFGQQIQDQLNPGLQDLEPDVQDVQRQMQQDLNAIAGKYRSVQLLDLLLHLVSAVLLVVGSAMVLRRTGRGIPILIGGFAVAIVYLLLNTGLTIVVQLQSLPIIQEMIEQAGDAEGAPAEAGTLALFGVIVGIIIAVVIALAKLIFYLIGLFYVRRSEVRALMQF